MQVTTLLADAAQVADGKVYALGLGWTVAGPMAPIAVVVLVRLDAEVDAVDQPDPVRNWTLALLDDDDVPVFVGDQPVRVEGQIGIEGMAGLAQVPIVIAFGPLGLAPGRYRWQVTIDGFGDPAWDARFEIVEAIDGLPA